jgi:hypothetical protein
MTIEEQLTLIASDIDRLNRRIDKALEANRPDEQGG